MIRNSLAFTTDFEISGSLNKLIMMEMVEACAERLAAV